MQNKPPKSLIFAWLLCILWAIALTPILEVDKRVNTVMPLTSCNDIAPIFKIGSKVIKRGPKAVLVNGIVTWELIIDDKIIINFESSNKRNQSLYFMFGLLLPFLVFASSLYNWSSGKWGNRNINT